MPYNPQTPYSTLLYLFADKFVPKAEGHMAHLMGACKTPASGVDVKSMDLAIELVAASLFGLKEHNLLKWRIENSKVLWMFPCSKVILTSLDKNKQAGLPPGFDNSVLEAAGKKNDGTIDELLNFFFPNAPIYPQNNIIDALIRETITGGWQKQEGKKVAPVPEKISELESAVEEFAGLWNNFKVRESELYKQIFTDAKKSICSHSKGKEAACDTAMMSGE